MPEPPPRPPYTPTRPYYGSGYAGVGFRGIGGDLLKAFPKLTPATDAPPIDPTIPEFASHGAHLLAPVVSGPGGFRISPCPVCRSHELLPRTAGGWVPLRCSTCGTEFIASDGRTPPPPPLPPPPVFKPKTYPLPPTAPPPARPAVPTGLFAPMLPGLGGVRMARCPVCHTLENVPGRGGWVNLRCGACGTEFTATDGSAPPPPVPPTPTPEILRRNLERWVATGEPERWVAYRKGAWGEIELSGLMESLVFSDFWPIDRNAVRAALTETTERYRTKLAAATRAPAGKGTGKSKSPPPSPSLWDKIRKWFSGG